MEREEMVRPGCATAVLAVFVVYLILASGCTGQGGPQSPTPTLTVPTTRPPTPVPETPTPVGTETTQTPVTPTLTPAWTPGSVVQGSGAILIRGDVVGFKSAQGNFIDEIRFTVVKAPQAEPVTFEVPNTQIIFTKGGPEFGVNYMILSGDVNGNHMLEDGETFLVSVPFPPQSPQYEIYSGQEFTMTIKNPPQPPVTVTAGAPPVLTDSMILARAPS